MSTQDNGKEILRLNKVRIITTDHEGVDREYIFDQDAITIGSDAECDVVLQDSRVSKRHCRIVKEADNYVLIDEDSTNGTFLNGVRIKEAFLEPKSRLSIGMSNLFFDVFGETFEITPSYRSNLGELIGRSVKMRKIFALLEKVAPTSTTVVIQGETGTGKEVVARTLHKLSPRAKKPFVVFDCGAVPKDLIESELFGHEKGSFTGAVGARQGLFEFADSGSLFLDEIGELSLELQPKLLRVLEQREIRRVGSNRPVRVDARLIAATNRDLQQEVQAGRFREDLFYRLSVVTIHLPPLRERTEDIPLLVRHFLAHSAFNRGPDDQPRVKGVSADALDLLMSYKWPGNVRELLHVVERAVAFAEHEFLTGPELLEHMLGSQSKPHPRTQERTEPAPWRNAHPKRFKEAKEEWLGRFEKEYIHAMLQKHGYKIAPAAREAGLDRKYFRQLARKYGLIEGGKTNNGPQTD